MVSGLFASGHARYETAFRLAPRQDSSLKRCYEIIGGGHLNMKTQIPNIMVVCKASSMSVNLSKIKNRTGGAIFRVMLPGKFTQ